MSHHEEQERALLPAWLDFLLTALVAVGLAALIRIYIAGTYAIPSSSMVETLQVGDRVLGEKLSLRWKEPARGEIVTFDDPEDPAKTLIKRVIATQGQTVDLIEGFVYVDGVRLDEPYVNGLPSYPLTGHAYNLTADLVFPLQVPEGCLWVMGDNRTNSLDSRYFGPIPVTSVTSRAVLIYWPPEDFGSL